MTLSLPLEITDLCPPAPLENPKVPFKSLSWLERWFERNVLFLFFFFFFSHCKKKVPSSFDSNINILRTDQNTLIHKNWKSSKKRKEEKKRKEKKKKKKKKGVEEVGWGRMVRFTKWRRVEMSRNWRDSFWAESTWMRRVIGWVLSDSIFF